LRPLIGRAAGKSVVRIGCHSGNTQSSR
jgi:hypothetical protein